MCGSCGKRDTVMDESSVEILEVVRIMCWSVQMSLAVVFGSFISRTQQKCQKRLIVKNMCDKLLVNY